VPVPEKDLPVVLPEDAEFLPTGDSPLALHQGFLNVPCPDCGKPSKRETDTMDTFVDSSWYFLRYTSPNYSEAAFDPEAAAKWVPVDQYTGGVEHAVMHLLYARFFVKALRDLGLLSFDEPFKRLFNQGTIISGHEKMSKSRGNVVAPDDFVKRVGADAMRCYLMFLGPWDQGGEWNDSGLNGMFRWTNRVWELAHRDPAALKGATIDEGSARDLTRLVHQTIRKVSDDLEKFKYNTAIAALMEYTNSMARTWDRADVSSETWEQATETLLLLMAPLAPHITEELWERAGHSDSIHNQTLPEWDPEIAAEDEITLVVQVNGRLRDRIQVPASIEEGAAKQAAIGSEKVMVHTEGKTTVKVIYVPGRLVNIVVR
jgi:leucyl-tRNA synthetase